MYLFIDTQIAVYVGRYELLVSIKWWTCVVYYGSFITLAHHYVCTQLSQRLHIQPSISTYRRYLAGAYYPARRIAQEPLGVGLKSSVGLLGRFLLTPPRCLNESANVTAEQVYQNYLQTHPFRRRSDQIAIILISTCWLSINVWSDAALGSLADKTRKFSQEMAKFCKRNWFLPLLVKKCNVF